MLYEVRWYFEDEDKWYSERVSAGSKKEAITKVIEVKKGTEVDLKHCDTIWVLTEGELNDA